MFAVEKLVKSARYAVDELAGGIHKGKTATKIEINLPSIKFYFEDGSWAEATIQSIEKIGGQK